MPTRDGLESIDSEFELTDGHSERIQRGNKKYKIRYNSVKENLGYMEYDPKTGRQIFKVYEED